MNKNFIKVLVDSLNGNVIEPMPATTAPSMREMIQHNPNLVFIMNHEFAVYAALAAEIKDPVGRWFTPVATMDEMSNGVLGYFYGRPVYSNWFTTKPADSPENIEPRFGVYDSELQKLTPLSPELFGE